MMYRGERKWRGERFQCEEGAARALAPLPLGAVTA
jgi:hypothetical protein